jgi:pyruvate,water dikinase
VFESIRTEEYVYLKKASAIVTDSGGKTSNAAIFARTQDIPAVTGTVEGTSILQDGQKVIVDGTEGAVYEMVVPPRKEIE